MVVGGLPPNPRDFPGITPVFQEWMLSARSIIILLLGETAGALQRCNYLRDNLVAGASMMHRAREVIAGLVQLEAVVTSFFGADDVVRHNSPRFTMLFRIVSNLRITATNANFFGLPRATSR